MDSHKRQLQIFQILVYLKMALTRTKASDWKQRGYFVTHTEFVCISFSECRTISQL